MMFYNDFEKKKSYKVIEQENSFSADITVKVQTEEGELAVQIPVSIVIEANMLSKMPIFQDKDKKYTKGKEH